MASDALISVIVPVYNVERYLADCLESVCAQTHRTLEILCINDGSTDGSGDILARFQQRDAQIRRIDKTNGGLSSARNAGLAAATGDFVLFVDSDDVIDPHLCERALARLRSSGADFVIFAYQAFPERFRELLAPPAEMFRSETVRSVEEKTRILTPCYAWMKLWRRDFLLRHALAFPEGLCYEDNPHHWKAVTLATSVAVLPDMLYHYRQRRSSITGQVGAHLLDIIPIVRQVRDDLLETGQYAAFREAFLAYKLKLFHVHFELIASRLKPLLFSRILDELGEDERHFVTQGQDMPPDTRRFYETAFHHAQQGSRPLWIRKRAVYTLKRLVRPLLFPLAERVLRYHLTLLRERVEALREENRELTSALRAQRMENPPEAPPPDGDRNE